MNGILIVDKPMGKTSFDMIRETRKEYNIKKVGHIGTLDPMATGVLPILIGEATKLSDYLIEHDKEYIAVLKLGEKRETGDNEGKIIQTCEISEKLKNDIDIARNECNETKKQNTSKIENANNILKIFNSFLGETMQVPPMYSALKVNGKKLYDLARQGQVVERLPRKIVISNIEIIKINEENEITFKVECSKGTYIRVLCEDIAEKMGNCGYMKSLKRTRVGNFKIEDAGKFIELENILNDVPRINILEIKSLLNGIPIKTNEQNGLCNLYYDDKFIGIGQIENKLLKRKIII